MTVPPSFPVLPGQNFPTKTPMLSTLVAAHVSGREVRNQLWSQALYAFELKFEGLDSGSVNRGLLAQSLQSLMGLFLQVSGQLGIFLYTDPSDCAVTGQYIGTGDGSTTNFTFQRTLGGYTENVGWVTQINNVYLNGVAQSPNAWGATYPNTLSFGTAPGTGVAITADFSYAFVCRFTSDSQDFDEFMSGFWSVSSIKFRSVKDEAPVGGSIPYLPDPAMFPLNFTLGVLPANVFASGGANGTYVNSSGNIAYATGGAPRFDYSTGTCALLVEPAATNLLSYSNNFAGTFWTETGATATANATTAPDGTATAQSLTDSTANSNHKTVSQAVSVTETLNYALSGYLKYSNHQYVCVCLQDGTTSGDVIIANFDLINGTVRSVADGTTTLLSASIKSAGNGWWRCSLVGAINGPAGTVIAQLFFANSSTANRPTYAGTGSDVFYAWGFQLELGSSASSLIPTSGGAATRSADAITFTMPAAKSSITFTFGDGTTQTVSGFTPGASAAIPTNLNETRIAQAA